MDGEMDRGRWGEGVDVVESVCGGGRNEQHREEWTEGVCLWLLGAKRRLDCLDSQPLGWFMPHIPLHLTSLDGYAKQVVTVPVNSFTVVCCRLLTHSSDAISESNWIEILSGLAWLSALLVFIQPLSTAHWFSRFTHLCSAEFKVLNNLWLV